MRVYEKLANNKDLVISGTSDPSTNLVAVADAILQGMDHSDGAAQSAVLAELALINHGFAKPSHAVTTN